MIRTTWLDGQPVKVKSLYSVVGSNDPSFPYVNDLQTIREAIEIARSYTDTPIIGKCRVKRHNNIYYPDSECGRHISYQTHEWYVHKDGRIESTGWNKDRQIKSPSKILANSILQEAKHRVLMESAAKRDTKNISPEDYNKIIATVLSSFIGSARMAGFNLGYQGKPEYRAQGDEFLVKSINESLALSGYRTLDTETLLDVMKRIQLSDLSMFSNTIDPKLEKLKHSALYKTSVDNGLKRDVFKLGRWTLYEKRIPEYHNMNLASLGVDLKGIYFRELNSWPVELIAEAYLFYLDSSKKPLPSSHCHNYVYEESFINFLSDM